MSPLFPFMSFLSVSISPRGSSCAGTVQLGEATTWRYTTVRKAKRFSDTLLLAWKL